MSKSTLNSSSSSSARSSLKKSVNESSQGPNRSRPASAAKPSVTSNSRAHHIDSAAEGEGKNSKPKHRSPIRRDRDKVLSDEVARLAMSLQQFKQKQQEENSTYKMGLVDITQMYEKQIADLIKNLENERARCEGLERKLDAMKKLLSDHDIFIQQHQVDYSSCQKVISDTTQTFEKKISELTKKIEECDHRRHAEEEIESQRKLLSEKSSIQEENQLSVIQKISCGSSSFQPATSLSQPYSDQTTKIAEFFEELGLENILSMLSSDDIQTQTHAVKLVANLLAEDANQEKIVNGGGLDALLMILRTSQNTIILKTASGAIANLAMNETYQGFIISKGGAQLLASTTTKTDDPQALRMVAGAIANLCGNGKLHMILKQDGCIKALLEMSTTKHVEVVAQVSRALANFAKREPREVTQGNRKGPSLLIEEGAFTWLIDNYNDSSILDPIRRHIELALCHLAQNEDNTQDFISSGGLKEVIQISQKSTHAEIRNLATKALKVLNPTHFKLN